jgi:hypothetical protein
MWRWNICDNEYNHNKPWLMSVTLLVNVVCRQSKYILVNVSKNDDKNTYWTRFVTSHNQTISKSVSATCGNKDKHRLMLVINHNQTIPCTITVNNNQ